MVSPRNHKRTEFPAKVRGAAIRRCCDAQGHPRCEGCGAKLGARAGVIFEHVTPDGLGGTATLDNCKVHCKNCADRKTFQEDNPRMVKADRGFRKEFKTCGTKKKMQSRPFEKAPPQRTASSPLKKRVGAFL